MLRTLVCGRVRSDSAAGGVATKLKTAALLVGAAADVEEIGGLSAVQVDDVKRGLQGAK